MEEIFSCEDVARRYGVKVSTVYSWIHSNVLPAIKVGGLYRFHESDLIAFENKNKTM